MPHKNISSKLAAILLIKHNKSAIELTVTKEVCHVSYFRCNIYHLCPVVLYITFPHCLINDMTLDLKRCNTVTIVVSSYDVVSPFPHC